MPMVCFLSFFFYLHMNALESLTKFCCRCHVVFKHFFSAKKFNFSTNFSYSFFFSC